LASTSCLPVILALNHLSFSFAQWATSLVCCPRNPPPSPAPLSTPIFSRPPPNAESGAPAGTCGAGESGVHVGALAGMAQGVMTFAGVLKPGAGEGAGGGAAATANADAGDSASSTAANADDGRSNDGAVCGGADRHGPEDDIDDSTEEVDGAGACSLACSACVNCVCLRARLCLCVCVCARARARVSNVDLRAHAVTYTRARLQPSATSLCSRYSRYLRNILLFLLRIQMRLLCRMCRNWHVVVLIHELNGGLSEVIPQVVVLR
jgi:hypothetical protein